MANTNTKKTKNKPVIMQILPSMQSGGVERGTVEIARALVKNGYESIVASSGGHMINQLENHGTKHINLPLDSKNPFVIYKNSRRIRNIIKKYNVDIVHARSRAPAWSAYLACKKTKCKFITTFHGVYSFNNRLKKFYNSVMVKGQKVIAASEFIKNHIIDNYNVNKKNVELIARGVDLQQFDIEKVPSSRLLEMSSRLELEHDRPVILLPGRITKWKGHEFLLEALRKIPKGKFLCIFAGDDKNHKKYREKLEAKIVKYELYNDVVFIRNIKDMPALYSLVDIVISASLRPEAFGRVAIEAQAMQRLLIATAHGGSIETVIDGKTGFLVEPGNVDQMADKIKELMEISDRKRKTIANKAKKNIQENYSMDKMIAKTLAVYDEILKTRKRKASK